MDEAKQARISATEGFLSLLSGMRKIPAMTPEDRAYNNALADAFDFYVEKEPGDLYPHTVRMGKWVRD